MEEHLSYDRLIAAHRSQINPQPFPPNTLTFAFGLQRYEKMALELAQSEDALREKVLIEVNLDFQQAFAIVQSIQSLLPEQLIHALSTRESDRIRELASRSLVQVALVKDGRDFLLESGVVEKVAALFDDRVEAIKVNAYNCLLNLSVERAGCEGTVDEGVVEILVDKLLSEKSDSVLVFTLRLIKQLLEVANGPKKALQTAIISRLRNLLSGKDAVITELAASNLSQLSFSYPGKVRVIEEDCVVPLAQLLGHSDAEVRATATLALGSLTIEKAAKVILIEQDYLDQIAGLLYDESTQVRLNTVQLIANLAEHPIAKAKYQESLEKLREMQASDSTLIRKFAKKTIGVITWLP